MDPSDKFYRHTPTQAPSSSEVSPFATISDSQGQRYASTNFIASSILSSRPLSFPSPFSPSLSLTFSHCLSLSPSLFSSLSPLDDHDQFSRPALACRQREVLCWRRVAATSRSPCGRGKEARPRCKKRPTKRAPRMLVTTTTRWGAGDWAGLPHHKPTAQPIPARQGTEESEWKAVQLWVFRVVKRVHRH